MKQGKRGRAWSNARRKIKTDFERNGVTTCELRFEGCLINNFLGFAHSRRRRFITDEQGLFEVCLACQKCHETLDRMSHEETYQTVINIIENRETAVEAY